MHNLPKSNQRHSFNGARAQLSALTWGNTNQPVMILVHGIKDLAWSMASIAEAFADNYFVIAPDLRGHGDSENPGSYAMPHFVADLKALYQHFAIEQAVIVAHSLGGHICAQYASLFPQTVSALVMLDGMGPPLTESDFSTTSLRQNAVNDVQQLTQPLPPSKAMTDLADVSQRLSRNNPKLDDTRLQLLAQQGSYCEQGRYYWKWDTAASEIWSTLHPQLNPERWLFITCPVLLVHGDAAQQYWNQMGLTLSQTDIINDYEHRRQWFSNASTATVPDASHMLHYDAPEATNAVIKRFLAAL